MQSRVRQCRDTHEESDLPALHSAHLEDDVLGLVIGQGYAAADLVVADGKNRGTARLRVVTDTGIQLHAPVVPHLPGQLQKLLQREVGEVGGSKTPLETDENLMQEATAILEEYGNTFFFWTMRGKALPFLLCDSKAWGGSWCVPRADTTPASFTIVSLLLLLCSVHSGNKNIQCMNDEEKSESNTMI